MPAKGKSIAISWTDPDDAPEWTADVFERRAHHGDNVVQLAQGTRTRRGRPKLESPKRQVTLRLADWETQVKGYPVTVFESPTYPR